MVELSLEIIGLSLAIASVAVVAVVFFIRMESRQEQVLRSLERIVHDLERIASESHREHRELMNEIVETRKAQAAEHKEMIFLMKDIRDPLIEVAAILKGHVAEERIKV